MGINSAMPLSIIKYLMKEMPTEYLDVGLAEQHAV
jgi:deoxyxylulose-5-phosphate synthase